MARPSSYTPELAEIYALCDPDTNEIRYIGKANNSKKRLKGHIRDSRRRNTPIYCWIRKLLANQKYPALVLLERAPAEKWKEAEIRLIEQHKSKRLLNVALGGDEPFCPHKVRADNGRKNAIARVSTESKAALYKAKRDLGKLLKDGYVSEGTKQKMRLAAFKRPDLFGNWALI